MLAPFLSVFLCSQPLSPANQDLPGILEYVPEDALVCAWSTVGLPTLYEELGDGLIGRVWSAPEMTLFRSELDLWTLEETPQIRELLETLTLAEGPLAAFASPQAGGTLLGFLVDPGRASLWPTTRDLLVERGFSIRTERRDGGSLHLLGSEVGSAAMVLDADGAFGILRFETSAEGDPVVGPLIAAGERLLASDSRSATRHAKWSTKLAAAPDLLEGTALLRMHVDLTRILEEVRASPAEDDRETRELIERVLTATGLDRMRWIEAAFASGGPTAPLRLAVAIDAPAQSLAWRLARQLGSVPQELFFLTPETRLQEVMAFSVRPFEVLEELRGIAQEAGLDAGLEAGLSFFEDWSALNLEEEVLPLIDGRALLFTSRATEQESDPLPTTPLDRHLEGLAPQDSLRLETTLVLGSETPEDLADVVEELLAASGQEGRTVRSEHEGGDLRRADLGIGSVYWSCLPDAVVLSSTESALKGILAAEASGGRQPLQRLEALHSALEERPQTAYLSLVDGAEQLRTWFALVVFAQQMQPSLWPLASLPDPAFLERFSTSPQVTRLWHAADVLWFVLD